MTKLGFGKLCENKEREIFKVDKFIDKYMIRELHYLKAMGYDFVDEDLKRDASVTNFKELQDSVSSCTLCHFSKTRKHVLIEREQKNVKLFILGTHAQKSENESGVLLDSSRGRDLKELIWEVLRLKREEFYFSYLFKCFSCSKFDDFSLQSCLPFFWSELRLVQPKIVLCLGEYAFEGIGFRNFSVLRGEVFAYGDFFIMPSFELGFIEKNPSYKRCFIDDLKKIKGFL